MNRLSPPDDKNRFSGTLRHYHRTGPGTHRSWDDWVEGHAVDRKQSRRWGRIVMVALALMTLGGIIAGLIIELR